MVYLNQLWIFFLCGVMTLSSAMRVSSPASSTAAVTCDTARMKCAFRVGCGMALQNYLVGCADMMSGRIRHCSASCKQALIALTSTEEGQDLMRCDCQGQEFCEETKRRVEVCRPEVMRANQDHTVVSCSVAQWICMADPLCSTAVEYYHRLCRSMFHGRKCTMRCNNSIAILNRQEKAAKLKTCVCDGTEDYDCQTIKYNMDRLCFHKPIRGNFNSSTPGDVENEIQPRDTTGTTRHKNDLHLMCSTALTLHPLSLITLLLLYVTIKVPTLFS